MRRRDPGEGRRKAMRASSSALRLAPSPGAPDSNVSEAPWRPRMHRSRSSTASRPPATRRKGPRHALAGIDIAAETHSSRHGCGRGRARQPTRSPRMRGLRTARIGSGRRASCWSSWRPPGIFENLFAPWRPGHSSGPAQPLRRIASREDLARTKTDAIDALGLARFGAQKRPAGHPPARRATEELRELVRLRIAWSRTSAIASASSPSGRRGFRSSPGTLRGWIAKLATALLQDYPPPRPSRLSVTAPGPLCYDGRHQVGAELAQALIVRPLVGRRHHAEPTASSPLRLRRPRVLRRRLRTLERHRGAR